MLLSGFIWVATRIGLVGLTILICIIIIIVIDQENVHGTLNLNLPFRFIDCCLYALLALGWTGFPIFRLSREYGGVPGEYDM